MRNLCYCETFVPLQSVLLPMVGRSTGPLAVVNDTLCPVPVSASGVLSGKVRPKLVSQASPGFLRIRTGEGTAKPKGVVQHAEDVAALDELAPARFVFELESEADEPH